MTAAVDMERIRRISDSLREVHVSILPPGEVSAPVSSAQNVIEGICTRGVSSFEISGDGEAVAFGVRGADLDDIVGQLEEHYPHAQLDIPSQDPMELRDGERAFTSVLKVAGPEPVPIQTYDDDRVSPQGTDPLLKVLGAFRRLRRGERVLLRLVARPRRHNHFKTYEQDARAGPGSSNVRDWTVEQDAERGRSSQGSGFQSWLWIILVGIVAFAAIALYGLGFNEDDVVAFIKGITVEQLTAVAFGVVTVGAGLIVLFLLALFFGLFQQRGGYYDSELVPLRVDHKPFDLEIQVVVFVRDSEAWRTRAQTLANQIAREYASYDHARGSSIARHRSFDGLPDDALRLVSKRRMLGLSPSGAGSVVGSLEMAALWHLPGSRVRPGSVQRTTYRSWPVHSRFISEGAPVGVTTAGASRVIRLGSDAMSAHQFYVAASRMGKSTLIKHVVGYAMRQKALGEYPGAIVVVDPHGDLVSDLLGLVPPDVAHRVRFIDLADEDRVPGVNILSPQFSSDRDVTADLLVQVFSRHWRFWGPNMSDILSHSVQTLYEANTHPDVRAEDAYTLLDARQLWGNEAFRRSVLQRVRDANQHRFWSEDFPVYERGEQMQTLNPIRNRLRAYADSRVASAILGQRFSTIDFKGCIQDGDILLISTGGESRGREVARLLGSYFLAMIDYLIRSQGELEPGDRQRVMVVVDEMHRIAGAPYEGMLAEWSKFGGALVLATQDLAQVRNLSTTLEASLLTNVGVLASFRLDEDDADTLAGNLGRERISKEDIRGLPRHHAYVRLSAFEESVPAFSMKVLPPVAENEIVAGESREKRARYTQKFETVYNRLQHETLASMGINAAADEKRRRRKS